MRTSPVWGSSRGGREAKKKKRGKISKEKVAFAKAEFKDGGGKLVDPF
jgi:hypothetical protein